MEKKNSYTDVICGVAIGCLAIIMWYLASIAVAERVMPASFGYISSFVTGITGTFLGAYFAFRFNNRREEEEKLQEKVHALRSGLFALIRQINVLGNANKSLKHQAEIPFRHIALPAKLASGHASKNIPISKLEFLLDVEPNLLMELSVAQDKYYSACEAINDRFEFHLAEIQPALEKIGEEHGEDELDASLVRNRLGERIWHTSISHADNVHELVPDGISSLQVALENLRVIAHSLFPGNVFIDFEAADL